jgi:hypothetical protein
MRLRWLSGRGTRIASVGLAAVAFVTAGCASGGGGRAATSSRQASSNAGCPSPGAEPAQVVNASGPAVDPQSFQGIAAGMCLTDVLGRLGPAHKYTASTPFQFEWKATDGRSFQVGIPSLRDKAVYARWSK